MLSIINFAVPRTCQIIAFGHPLRASLRLLGTPSESPPSRGREKWCEGDEDCYAS